MDLYMFLIIGFAVAFNFLVILTKYRMERYADATLDVALLTIISFLFAGSFGGLVVATVASFIISLFLLFFPPKLPSLSKIFD